MNLSSSHYPLALTILAHILAKSILKNGRHEIRTSHISFQTAINLLRSHIKVLLALPLGLSRYQQTQGPLNQRKLVGNSMKSNNFHRIENQPDPRVKLAILQAVERLTEHQITSNVKSGKVHPALDINERIPVFDTQPQFVDKRIDIASD